jgi:type IV pilus assembly protein PilF
MSQIFSIVLRLLLVTTVVSVIAACASVQEQEREAENQFQIADTNVRLGLGYLKQGRDEAALEKLQKAVDAMPEYAEAHSSIALAYERLEQPNKAAEHYERAVELKPKDGSIQNNYAVFLCGQGKYEEAEKHFLRAIQNRKYRTPAQALENLGMCMAQIPDWVKAETYLRKALKMDPKLPGALLQMARVSFEKKSMMSTRAYLQRYREVAPLGPDGLWLGIQVEKKLGDKAAALEYETLLRKNYADSNEMRLLLEAEEKERAGAQVK